MIEIPLIEELREIRRRLSEEQGKDAVRYAAMLRKVSQDVPGIYVTRPLRSGGAKGAPPPKRIPRRVPLGKR